MALASGTRLGPYEIVALVGAGGMGEVYRASDTRLNRTVAIKVLPPLWVGNPDMMQRFEREAQAIAGLSHPHICTLHDVGDHAGTAFLVMEYLEGESLAARVQKGPLPVQQALAYAIEIAGALDKAHRQGIVHRDLKPGNVMLTKSGAKLLDFGLAKIGVASAVSSGETRLVTTPAVQTQGEPLTARGSIVGTFQYMAPEQIEGRDADARTDLFAFGAVLYEMLTGRRAFEGKSQPSVIGAIMTSEPPPLSTLQPMMPAGLERIVRRCLAKDPEDRWQTAHDLMIQLQWVAGRGAQADLPAAADPRQRKRDRLMVGLIAVTVLLTTLMAVPAFLYFRGPKEPDEFQLRVPVYGLSNTDIAVSPDGKTIALVARPNTQEASSLFVRPTGSVVFKKLAGTDDATQPFWSPDNRSIGFVAGGRLKKVDASGGSPKDIAEAQGFSGGTWNLEGTIVFGSAKGLQRVSAEGGKTEALTTVAKLETGHFWPYFLPDGHHFLYLSWSADASDRAIFAGTLDSKDKTRLMSADSNAQYAAPGYVLYHREASLFAQPFDVKKLALTGDPIQVAGAVAFNQANGRGYFDVSQDGALIYVQGTGGPTGRAGVQVDWQFGWMDRTGRVLERAGEPGSYGDMDLSADGRLIAVTRQDPGAPGADIWVIDWQRNVSTRLTLDPADDINPIWSPDGSRIAFTTFRKGNPDVWVKNANGVGEETPLLDSSSNEFIEDWSKDGRYIAYKFGQDPFEDIYVLPTFGDKKPFPAVQGRFRKDEPQFSYDGKWLAYDSDESGTFEVYVTSFPALDQKLKLSNSGGGRPRWRRDGKEIFYRLLQGGTMAVDFTPGPKIDAGIPHQLFTSPFAGADPTRHQLAVAPDGQRILGRVPSGCTGRGGVPAAPNTYFPPGRAGQPVPPGGGRGVLSNGLTVVRHWTTTAAARRKP